MVDRKSVFRWGGAAIAAICATIIGSTSGAYADETCGLKQAQAFQMAITHPTEEGDPTYFLKTSERFIAQCPDRLEVRDAHLIAARGALDSGQAERAVEHYDSAQALGVRLTPEHSIDYAVALMALDADGRATAVRRSAIAAWAAGLTQSGLGTLDIASVDGGQIFSAVFDAVDPDKQISAVWIADPAGEGLPAAIVLRQAPQRAAWRALRNGKTDPAPLMVADLHQCRQRNTLLDSVEPLAASDVDAAAKAALTTYLESPDTLATTKAGKPLASCLSLPFMLHMPNPMTAVYPGQ